jgi:muramoyltetrapeptide carboxypeptidase
MSSILRPRALKAGDPVVVAALSGGLDPDEEPLLAPGIKIIEQMGFAVRVSPLVAPDRQWWWSAASPQETADELNSLLRDPQVRAIFGFTGGRTVLSYLDLIDLDAVRNDPKPILGFSDISVLHLALYARTGLVGMHADIVTHGFGAGWYDPIDEDRRKQLFDIYGRVLASDKAPGTLPPGRQWECWRPGRAQGPLVGGMLNRLVRIQATRYAVSPAQLDGAILFWEEAFTSTAGVWTDLHALRHAGVLDRIAGMVVGAPVQVAPTEGGPETLREVVLDVIGDRDIPILGHVDVGHMTPNLPMPLGVLAELDADALTLSLLEPAVAA